MSGNQRLEYVDVFRGIALLTMVAIQIFDYLSVSDIYRTPPYYVETINSVTWVPPSLLFTFVSGMSVFLLVTKLRQTGNLGIHSTLWEAAKRYGKYVAISLPFTMVMWGLDTYLGWEEAIQGIGLAAIFTALFLLLVFRKAGHIVSKQGYVVLTAAIIILAFMQSMLPKMIGSSEALSSYPRQTGLGSQPFSILGSVILNALFRGWFSVINLLPMMLGGVLLMALIKSQSSHKVLFAFGLAFLSVSIISHLLGYRIDYYGRSFALTFFAVGESALICSLAYMVYTKFNSGIVGRALGFLRTFGIASFFVYIAHYLLILKVLEITGLKDLLPDPYAWVLTVPLVVVVYFLARRYSRVRTRLPGLIRL